jgi:hypothetical protein
MKRKTPANGFWRLDVARAAQEQTQARGQNADAENENGKLDLRKRVFTLPNVGDHGGKAGKQSHKARVLFHRGRAGSADWAGPSTSVADLLSTYMRWHKPNRAHSHPSEP